MEILGAIIAVIIVWGIWAGIAFYKRNMKQVVLATEMCLSFLLIDLLGIIGLLISIVVWLLPIMYKKYIYKEEDNTANKANNNNESDELTTGAAKEYQKAYNESLERLRKSQSEKEEIKTDNIVEIKETKSEINTEPTIEDEIGKIYSKYFDIFRNQKIVNKSKIGLPLSSALLCVIIDYYIYSFPRRNESIRRIYSFVESTLNNDDLKVFDYSIDMMGKVIRGEITPRGVWDYNWGNSKDNNWLINLLEFYGDCISFDNYLFNYENEPIHAVGAIDRLQFYQDITSIFEIIDVFCKDFEGILFLD